MSVIRVDGRQTHQLRDIRIVPDVLLYAEGSCEISYGKTRVLCTATFNRKVPPYMIGKGVGWVTSEYSMLPRSSQQRIPRERAHGSGRSQEIKRLIGRSLRAVCDMKALGENTFIIDCDVIQADGGTRTASITGGFVALGLAMKRLLDQKQIPRPFLKDYAAGVSVGIVEERAVLDLCYLEDAQAEVDMNVVMSGGGKYIEAQGTAEKDPFSPEQLQEMLALAGQGISQLIEKQREVLDLTLPTPKETS